MASNTNDVVQDFSPVLKVYKDGTVERLIDSAHVPPSPEDPTTGVSSKDITISQSGNVSARLFLPKNTGTNHKFPVLVYFHGGGFCIGSAFSPLYNRYINILASQANALTISVEYRLAPEHLLPVAYEDSWTALQWVASHHGNHTNTTDQDPWLISHGDFDRVFIGGDSAGGNIVHHMLLRAGREGLNGGVKFSGAFLMYPFFWGSKPLESESAELYENHAAKMLNRIWELVNPSAVDGCDNVMINPFAEGAPSLSGLGCPRLLVCAAEKDVLRERNVHYVEVLKGSGWKGQVELIVIEGEDHVFDIFNPDTDKAKDLMKLLAAYICK